MRIIFNVSKTELGNNGGSKSICHSANILQKMGHEVYVIGYLPNKFTWFPLEANYIELKHEKGLPDADAHIATGFQSVKYVMDAPDSKGVKFHWIRAHETWITKDFEKVYNCPTIKWVNSWCLKFFLKRKFDIDTEIIYPGIDLDLFRNDAPNRFRKHDFIVGALYNRKPRKRFSWVEKMFAALKRKYGARVALVMFGNDGRPLDVQPSNFDYVQQPNPARLNKAYNRIHIWLAPTRSEGLHICPLEAALCGCLVVATNAELAGMRDWLIDDHTGFMSSDDFNDYYTKVIDVIENCPADKAEQIGINSKEMITNVIGSRERNMARMVELIEREL